MIVLLITIFWMLLIWYQIISFRKKNFYVGFLKYLWIFISVFNIFNGLFAGFVGFHEYTNSYNPMIVFTDEIAKGQRP